MTEQESLAGQPPPTPKAIAIIPSRAELETLTEIANAMIAARMPLPQNCNTPQALLMKFLFGRELGLPPMVSLHEIDLIEGRAAMNARTQVAMIRRRQLGDVRLLRQTDTEAAVQAWRADDPDSKFEFIFTMEDAQRAGLADKKVWRKYPRSMLLARATSLATHALFQEVFLGVACTPEELGTDDLDENGRLKFVDTVATSGIQRKPVAELTTDEAGNIVAESARLAAESAELIAESVTPAKDREYVTTKIKTLVKEVLQLSPDDWSKVRRRWTRTDGSKMTFSDLAEMCEYLENLATISWMRDGLAIPADKWQKALERRGAMTLCDLEPVTAADFEEKLAAHFSPFDVAKLRGQLPGSVPLKIDDAAGKEAAASTAGNG